MILLVDVGNSNIVFGLSDGNKIVKSFRLKSFLDKTSDELYILFHTLVNDTFDDVVISSVVPVITSALMKLFKDHYNITPLVLGPGVKTGVMLKVDEPKTVGADIICDVAGASSYGEDILIVDLGTATKYILAHNNVFLGVAIAPGVSISMKALVSNAALLPAIEMQVPETIICTNTISCMQSGVIYGAAAQADGMIDRIMEETGKELTIIFTGGLAKLIAPLCKHKIIYSEHLGLEGLLYIYKKNRIFK